MLTTRTRTWNVTVDFTTDTPLTQDAAMDLWAGGRFSSQPGPRTYRWEATVTATGSWDDTSPASVLAMVCDDLNKRLLDIYVDLVSVTDVRLTRDQT